MKRLGMSFGIFSACILFSNFALGQESLSRNDLMAKTDATCAATMFTTGKLKISYNQQSDSEAEGMLKVGVLLLYLSALYSSQDEALAIYNEKNKNISAEIIKASNGGVSRAGIAKYVLNNLVPQNERCLKAIKDLESKMSYIQGYITTPEGLKLAKAVKGNTLDPLIKPASSSSTPNSNGN